MQEVLEQQDQTVEEQTRVAMEAAASDVPEKRSLTLDDVAEETTMRELERLRVEEGRFEFQQRRAKLFATSGLFATKGVTGPMAIAQAMVKIELGESMGFSPAEALQGIFVINGVTSIASALRAARMQAAGYDWDIDWLGTEDDCAGCRLWLYLNGKPVLKPRRNEKGEAIRDESGKPLMEHVSQAFTKADATKMKTTLWEGNNKRRASILEKDNWQMSPRNMYFARAITNLQRFHAPKVLNVNIASVEEAMDKDAGAETYTSSDGVANGSEKRAREVRDEKMAALAVSNVRSEPEKPRVTNGSRQEAEPVRTEKAKAAAVNHLGAKNGVAIYDGFPAAEITMHGQKIYVQNESTGKQPRLFAFDSEIERQNGGKGEFLPLEEPAEEKPSGTGPRAIRK